MLDALKTQGFPIDDQRALDGLDLSTLWSADASGFADRFVFGEADQNNEEPDILRLYLQESRAPAAGARAPIRALADRVRQRSIDLTEVAVDHGLLRIPDPRISALAVVGAVETLGWAVLSGHLDAPRHEIAGTLISLVLSGIRR